MMYTTARMDPVAPWGLFNESPSCLVHWIIRLSVRCSTPSKAVTLRRLQQLRIDFFALV